MTATAFSAAGTPAAHLSDAMTLILDAVRCMGRAQDRVGTRSGAYDLLDVSAALERALPVLRSELRARFHEVPMVVRAELGSLSRAADRAGEIGRAMSSIVTLDAPSPGELAMHLDEWIRSASMLTDELEIGRA